MEYDGKLSIVVRAEAGYSFPRRWEDWKTLSPTQSFSRLKPRSRGSIAGPPSHPPAATTEAGPATAPIRRKSRRLNPGCALVMAGEPAAIPAGNHAPQRSRIHQENQGDMQQRE